MGAFPAGGTVNTHPNNPQWIHDGRLMRTALYVRVSTLDQNLDNQLDDLQKSVRQRGWEEAVVYSDRVSGAKDRRPGAG